MARTIGKKNVKLVQQITTEELDKLTNTMSGTTYAGVEEAVRERLPVELWDIWEMADQEINRIINDTCNSIVRK